MIADQLVTLSRNVIGVLLFRHMRAHGGPPLCPVRLRSSVGAVAVYVYCFLASSARGVCFGRTTTLRFVVCSDWMSVARSRALVIFVFHSSGGRAVVFCVCAIQASREAVGCGLFSEILLQG